MSLLVRKIDKGKWLQNKITEDEDVSADAITLCLRTLKNTLSVWKVSTEDEIKEAILAIISGSDHLETIDIVSINCQEIVSDGITLAQNPETARTRVQDLKNSHYDIINLSYSKLGVVSRHIVDCFKNGYQITNSFKERQVIRLTEHYLKSVLNEAIDNRRLKKADLPESIQRKLP